MRKLLRRRLCSVVVAAVALCAGHCSTCRASILLTFDVSFDTSASGPNDFLSNIFLNYYVPDQPGFPYTSLDPLSQLFLPNIPISDGSLHFDWLDTIADSANYARSYALYGIYNSVDSGAGESFFSTFSGPQVALGLTFDEAFVDLGYTEQQVLDALKGNDGTGLVLQNLGSYVLLGASSVSGFDNSAYQTLFDTPIQQGQNATLVHFTTGTGFGSASNEASTIPQAVPEPSTLVLSSILVGMIGLVWSSRRLKLAAPAS